MKEFDDFWNRALAEVAAIPLDVRQERIGDGVFRISLSTVGSGRIYGFLTLPPGDGPFPALVSVPGAGPGAGPDAELAKKGFAVLFCNVFPYETTEDMPENERRYEEFNREGLYIYRGAEFPEHSLLYAALLGISRAVDWLAAQPFVDAGRIGIFGSSQGGGLALMLAGLKPRFRGVVANVPAFCDHGGEKPGWPQFAAHGFDRMNVFDAAVFASRITCPVTLIAGLRDEVCPPESIRVAYGALRGPKELIEEPEMAHEVKPGYGRLQERLMAELKGSKMELELKLLPVSPVSCRVSVDARFAFRGVECSGVRLTLAGKEVMRRAPGAPNCAGWRSGVEKLDLSGQAGKVEVRLELLDASGNMIFCTSQLIEVVNIDSRSTGRINGAWCGLYHWSEEEGRLWNAELKNFTAVDWKQLVRSMHEVGMDVIVLQELFRNQEYYGKHRMAEEGYRGRAFYPSELVPGRMELACDDPVEAVFAAADEFGMAVLPGIGMYAWFDFTSESLDWHCRVAREVWNRYGHHRSFYGWYISEEVFGDLNRATETPREIVDFFRNFRKLRDELDPTLPVMLAPNCFDVPSALESWKLLARELDIICPFGFGRMPENDLTSEQAIALLQSIADEGGAHLWLDMEIFLFKEDMALYPRPVDEIFYELEHYRSFEKILCYQFPGLMNAPGSRLTPGGPDTVKLFNDYRRRIHAD